MIFESYLFIISPPHSIHMKIISFMTFSGLFTAWYLIGCLIHGMLSENIY